MSDAHQNADHGAIEADQLSLSAAVEAVLLTLDRPIKPDKLAEGLGLTDESDGHTPRERILEAVAALNEIYDQTRRAFRVEEVAGGLRLMTRSDFAPILTAFHGSRAHTRLSRAAVETLAVIAYRQPMTRAQLEAIRGVSCGEVLRTLVERRLITIKGRAEELGRPMLYGTTKEFLEVFGIASIKDLPSPEDLVAAQGE